ncbi:hypothetical protein HW115_19530 [Verrucomicrobiaceae bacterium N1E253]|uniref:SecDF P1 head subdomain domain-containing protein n=1 Tax=Oceaniferula marina TaxID=2748318 RepID=A0A851GSR0_9BACT|nr:hypothetical protein [Oceaniferula marina]NWK57820.1 hypothetical protein [Oceaniferula marina]
MQKNIANLVMLLLMASCLTCLGDSFRVSRILDKGTKGSVEMIAKDAGNEEKIFVEKLAIVSSKDVKEAYAQMHPDGGIFIRLTNAGGERMLQATKKMNHGVDRLAVILEGKVIHTATIRHNIGTSFQISGFTGLDYNERSAIARKIKPQK